MMAAFAALRPSEAAEALLSSSRPRDDMIRWADPSGRTALHLAAFAGSPQLCEWCLDNGADVDARDFTGATPLRDTLAGYLPAPPAVRVLLDHGATAVEEDVRLAVKFGMPSVVGMLLAAGAPALPNVPTSLAAKVNTARLQLGGPLYTQRAFLIETLFRHNALAFGAAVRAGAHLEDRSECRGTQRDNDAASARGCSSSSTSRGSSRLRAQRQRCARRRQ